MAIENHNCLYANGPGAIGPGTYVVQSLLNPRKSRGVITRMHKNTNGITPSELAGLYTLSDLAFPGTVIPLDYTFVRQLSGDLALVVSYYGSSNSSSGFRTVMTRTPSGYRQIPLYDVSEAYTNDFANYIGDPSRGVLRPKKIISVRLMVIRWSSVVYMDSRPNDNQSLIDKVNTTNYGIDGYSHAAETLQFGGTDVRHDKYGGSDRWTLHHAVDYDPKFKHRDNELVRGAKRDNGTWNFTLANGGNGVQNNDKAKFPNLP